MIWETLINQILQTSWIEIVAVLTGITSIWFSKKINILVYPVGIISLLLYVYIFYKSEWYANMALNFFYFLMNIYGWYHWRHPKNDEKELSVTFQNRKGLIFGIGICLIIFAVIAIITSLLSNSDMQIFDAFTSALGVLGMYLTTQKKVENWIYYLIADVMLIPMCIHNGLYFTSLQYIIYTYLAITAFFGWRKEALKS